MSLYVPTNVPLPPTGIPVVDDGDDPDAASVGQTFEALADGIRSLQDIVQPGDAGGAVTVTRAIGFGSVLLMDGNGRFDTFGSTGSGAGNVSNTPSGINDAFILVGDITACIPSGAVITNLAVLITSGTTSSGVPAGLPRLRFHSTDLQTGTSTPDTMHEEITDSSATQGVWQAKHLLNCPVSPTVTIDKTTKRYWYQLRGDYGATVTQSARYLGLFITFTLSQLPAGGV